jgi:hypothetical protein
VTPEISLLTPRRRKGFIRSTNLTLLAFCSGFLSRCLSALKFPGVINLAHLFVVPGVCVFVLYTVRTKDAKQIAISKSIIFGLFLFLISVFISALVNDTGVINAVMGYLLLAEPFMLLLTIVSLPLTIERCKWFRRWVVRFCFFHTFLVFVQQYVLHFDRLEGLQDNIQGIFYRSGAGHVVGASVALTFGLFYFLTSKTPLLVRVAVVSATFWHMLLADAKQVLLCLLVAGGLFMLTKLKDIREAIKYAAIAAVLVFVLLWCVENVPAFSAFNTWVRPEIYGPDGEATRLKMASFRIIPQYFNSPLNWWFGLGPGHTVGRLGGWMLDSYWELLGPLGATKSPVSGVVWTAIGASWLGDQSSLFSPMFGWAGIWGDYGPVGLGVYLYLSYLVWKNICKDDFSKYCMICVFVFGVIFSQMEEPGYMLFIAYLIGLRWHERSTKPIALPDESVRTHSLRLDT